MPKSSPAFSIAGIIIFSTAALPPASRAALPSLKRISGIWALPSGLSTVFSRETPGESGRKTFCGGGSCMPIFGRETCAGRSFPAPTAAGWKSSCSRSWRKPLPSLGIRIGFIGSPPDLTTGISGWWIPLPPRECSASALIYSTPLFAGLFIPLRTCSDSWRVSFAGWLRIVPGIFILCAPRRKRPCAGRSSTASRPGRRKCAFRKSTAVFRRRRDCRKEPSGV